MQNVAFNNILKPQITLTGTETTYFELHAGNIFLWMFAEQEYGSILDISIISHQVQIGNYFFCCIIQTLFGHTLCIYSIEKEIVNRIAVDFLYCGFLHRHIVPRQSHLLQYELLQCYTSQLLLRGTATQVILTFVGYRHIARFNDYLYILTFTLFEQVNVTDDAQSGDNLVWNILQ